MQDRWGAVLRWKHLFCLMLLRAPSGVAGEGPVSVSGALEGLSLESPNELVS